MDTMIDGRNRKFLTSQSSSFLSPFLPCPAVSGTVNVFFHEADGVVLEHY